MAAAPSSSASFSPSSESPSPLAPLRLYLVEDHPPRTIPTHIKDGFRIHDKGYLRVSAGPYRGQYLHRLIWQWTHPGQTLLPSEDIHHINGNPLDFTPANLEKVAHRHHSAYTQREGRLTRKRGKFASTKTAPKENEGSKGGVDADVAEECPF